MTHEITRIAGTRGVRGKRTLYYGYCSCGRGTTIYYGYCSCGRGTTTSASPASVARKLNDHAAGDDRGMYRRTT